MKLKKVKKILKRSLSVILTASMIFGISPQVYGAETNQLDLTQNLIAYYDFENVSGTEVPNKAGDNYKGALNGANVSIADSEVLGKSLKFADATDSYMSVPSVVNMGTTSYSISLWYKYDTSVNRDKSIVLLQQNGSGRTLVTLQTDNKYLTYVNQQNKYSTSAVNVEKWQHLTYTYDTETKKVKFYINGVLDSEQEAGDTETDALTDLFIGRHKSSGTDPATMKGFMDEIRIYNKVVSDQEASAIYQEKAGSILVKELQEKIDAAKELSSGDKLEATAPEAIALKEAIQEAEALNSQPSYEELMEVTSQLEQAVVAYRNASSVTITINPNTVQRTLDAGTFGINHRYAFNGYGSFDSETMEMREEFVNLYQNAAFGSIRYPGGTISNLFQWKASIGPVEKRVKQIHGFYNNSGQNGIAPNFGLTEIANFAYDERIQSEIIYVYGLGRGSAQDAADLIEYLNAPVGSNPNGGVAWASVRAKNGRQEPYGVRYFEIGNEMWQGGADGNTSQQYWLAGVPGGAEGAYINGGTAAFTKQYAVLKDNWNVTVSGGNGEQGQVRYMRYANPNPMTGENGDQLQEDFEAVVKGSVEVFVNDEKWEIVESFDGKAADAKVVTVDYRDGSFTFGDGVNGAIPQQGQSITVSYQVQRDGFVAVSRAMKETTQEIMDYYEEQGVEKKLECYAYSSFETQGFINTMKNSGYNDYYDGFTIHPYSGTPSGDGDVFYDNAMKLAETAGIQKVQNFVDMLPAGKVPVISEYGIFRSTNPLLRAQAHAVYIARVIMEYVRLGSPYIQKHCLVDWFSAGADSLGPTQQAVIQAVAQEGASTLTGEGPFRFFATPSASAIEMYAKYFGTDVVPSEFSYMDYMTNGAQKYSALASKDEEGNLYLAVVNLDREYNKRMELKVEGQDLTGREMTVYALAPDSYDAANSLENPDNVKIETTVQTIEGQEGSLLAKKHSFYIVKIHPAEETEIVEAESITLSAESISLKKGETATLEAEVLPVEAEDKTVTWTSEDGEIAKVENGVVTAMGVGTTTIKATTANGIEATCQVEVTEDESGDDSGEDNQEEQHTPSTEWTKNETHHWHTCTFQGCTENQVHDLAAHIWDSGKVTKQPTATVAGEKIFTCTVCGQTKVDIVPATGTPSGDNTQKPAENKPELEKIVQQQQLENHKPTDYTVDSWNVYSNALQKAQDVIKNPASSKEEIAAAISQLTQAAQGLKPVTETPETPQPPKKGDTIPSKDGAYQYKVLNAKEAQFVGVKGGVKTVKIANTVVAADGTTLKVTSVSNKALKGNKDVTKVVLGKYVKEIGASAFEGCTKLTSINLKNVTKIGDKAFKKCTSLKKVTIPKKVTNLGKSVFESCSKLSTIIIKATGLKKIGKNTFKGISVKAKIKVPKKNLAKYKKLLKNKGQSKKVTIR